jgi:hypothetical protein
MRKSVYIAAIFSIAGLLLSLIPLAQAAPAASKSVTARNESATHATANHPGPLTLKSYMTRPKLIVAIVIDQFRADYLTRFESKFLPAKGGNRKSDTAIGGFNYLMEKGAYFPFAEYEVLQNMTCPGHATILTGSLPYANHIPLNDWYDAKTGKMVYCSDDANFPLIGATGNGVAPTRLAATTVGDELKNSGRTSKVVTVSLKDRAAVMLGGHRADLAMWFDEKSWQWISSKYYLPSGELPAWLTELNSKVLKTIPEDTKKALATPTGNDVTVDAAIEAAKAFKLGQGKDTDVLAISFSSHDILGHHVGPNSDQMEPMTLSEDKNLARLFSSLNKTVPGGIENVTIVLTGDHGMAPDVEYSTNAKLTAGKIDQVDIMKSANPLLAKKFGKPDHGDWILATHSFNLYMNHEALSEKKDGGKEVIAAVKAMLMTEPGVEGVVTSTDYVDGTLPPGMYRNQIMNSYVPGESGDLIIIPKAFFMEIHDFDTHMTGYSYDRSVPLLLKGAHLKAGVYSTKAHVTDLAPTLSFLLGVLPPSHNEGRVLSEAISD